ncbi:hypothetical protein [Legionella sp. W05-934-2]|jgi:hypothetical protein|uniref:hypothetical protein n=1 Tax=Legionella sp. W05-934-2 TaxID=1198649 RepID=UPI003462FA5B
MAIKRIERCLKLAALAFILMASLPSANACPCFNYDDLIRQFQNHQGATCHLIHLDNSNILSVRLSDKDRIANASSTSCQFTVPFRNISNDYDAYERRHQNCIKQVIRACKGLNIAIIGADNVLKANMHNM